MTRVRNRDSITSVYELLGKRAIDLTVVILLLPLQLLVFVIVAPLIVVGDGGPIFYSAERRGKNGRTFTMYKYRSMKVNAPDLRNDDYSAVTSSNDPRVTRVGRVLRRTSVDELPQLFNVLIGDMSLVGPRPNLTRKDPATFTELECKRLIVRPGITGYSQATERNAATTEQKYEMDAFYVDYVSLSFDVKILLKTLTSVLGQRGINAG